MNAQPSWGQGSHCIQYNIILYFQPVPAPTTAVGNKENENPTTVVGRMSYIVIVFAL